MTQFQVGDRVQSKIDASFVNLDIGDIGTIITTLDSGILKVKMDKKGYRAHLCFHASDLELISGLVSPVNITFDIPETFGELRYTVYRDPKCDCGATSVGSYKHAHYCTLMNISCGDNSK